ncbi:RNA polymerase sigma factor [Spongiimicrobium salis]|uniref:RNA polymerase sigma factor n=1 Tax=Spongiimicrobium salis TaxID=1667022 RepID=UPI00374CF1E8
MSDYHDDESISGLLSGDDTIISTFYKKNFPAVKQYIVKNSGTEADAKDIFQDALVLTYQKLKSLDLRLECSLATYVFAVSRNLWMNTLRKRKREILYDDFPKISKETDEDILDFLHRKEQYNLYQKYFLSLGKECQKLLSYFFSGKSMQEISKRMNYSVGYTRKKKFDCKKQLLNSIEKSATYIELKVKPSKGNKS